MRKITSIIITACVFLVNFVQTALPEPKKNPAQPPAAKYQKKTPGNTGVNLNVGKPVPANDGQFKSIPVEPINTSTPHSLDGKGNDFSPNMGKIENIKSEPKSKDLTH